MKTILTTALGAILLPIALATLALARDDGKEIGYLERFALAADREKALEELIPGSRDYYYYHALHYQNTGQLDKVDVLLQIWEERHENDNRRRVIENRQILLSYDDEPGAALQRLRERLGLWYRHQREHADGPRNFPSILSQDRISREQFLSAARTHQRQHVGNFERTAYAWLIGVDLSVDERRDLLSRLDHPDFPDLPAMIAADLDAARSGGFGQHPVHSLLTIEQLEELRRLKPDLIHNQTFINTYLFSLRPGPDVDVERDLDQRRAYLERLWAFAVDLPPARNAIRLNILHHRLTLDRKLGVYDIDRFRKYIQIPRYAPYINEAWFGAQRERYPERQADTAIDFRGSMLLPPVGDDGALVRAYLAHFFESEDRRPEFREYLREDYLNKVFGETRLMAGTGDPEQLYSLLSPAEVQALRDRVDIDFAPTNPDTFRPDDPVNLDVDIKHVEHLLIRIYRINELNYYREENRQVDTTIQLDGLVPNHELTYTYDEPPVRRVRRSFELDAIDAPGVWVVDLIGNGRSSRAIINKGQLRYTMENGPAGHIFRIYDQDNTPRPQADLLIEGHRYQPDDRGRIVVPYTTRPARQKLIMIDGERATLDHFDHERETYRFDAGFHIEREKLIDQQEAELLIRPTLRLNNAFQPLALLNDVRLTVAATDLDGITTSQTVEDFTLNEDGDTIHRFRVPARSRSLAFRLEAKTESISNNETVQLHATETISINEIVTTAKLAIPYLTRDGEDHILEVRGRNGEPLPKERLSLRVRHRDVRPPLTMDMQSDENGRIHLGPLNGIANLNVRMADGHEQDWRLHQASYSHLPSLTGVAGDFLLVPWMSTSEQPIREEVGLLELRDGKPVSDRFDNLAIEDGYLVLRDLDPGDYQLLLKRNDERISVHVSDGQAHEGFVLGGMRYLERTDPEPMALLQPVVEEGRIRIHVRHAGPDTRVHVFGSRYMDAFNAYESFRVPVRAAAEVMRLPVADSVYVVGRDIGDEYRYILDRRSVRRYPGNMLARPGLLLNPWAVRETDTGELRAADGTDYDPIAQEEARDAVRRAETDLRRTDRSDPQDFNFLARPAAVLANLRPDENGVIEIDRDELGDRHMLWIVSIDGPHTAWRSVALEEADPVLRERRLPVALNPDRHFVQRRNIEVLRPGDALTFPDLTEARLEIYDSLVAVFSLFMTLNAEKDGDDTLGQFAFILDWPSLDHEAKLETYAEYASHELHFFLYHKDRDFFDEVIQPYLAHKKDKTFMDHYLLDRDLSYYAEGWAFAQLNAVERILLGRRLEHQQQIARHITDLFNLLPPDIDRDNRLFDLALQGSALATDGITRQFDDTVAVGRMRAVERAGFGFGVEESEMKLGGYGGLPPPAAAPPLQESAETRYRSNLVAADAIEERERVRRFYRDVPPTIEWAENNYYGLAATEQNADLIKVNAFWRDYAMRNGNEPFLSPKLAEASGSFAEMMLALAVLDLPFDPAEHELEGFDPDEAEIDRPVILTAASPLIAFFRQVEPVEPATPGGEAPILVSQNFFRYGDRYRMVDNERVDRFITDEFLIQTVYGAQVVVTNPTSSRRRLDVLMQVPEGAVPVLGDRTMRSRHVNLAPFDTIRVEYHFYFPQAGNYPHFPVHVAQQEDLVAHASPVRINVVAEPTEIDRESWDYVSQHGSMEQVIEYLKEHNVEDTDLERIAWRMRDDAFFVEVVELLEDRFTYDDTLWSYSLLHDHRPAIREYLRHQEAFVDQCGAYLDSTLLTLDPVERRAWELLEYDPLVNARAHQLGPRRRIANETVYEQYMNTLDVLAHRPAFDDDDRMTLSYYLLLQDRVFEAIEFFGQVAPDNLETSLQYDYFSAYMAFYTEELDDARRIAEARADHPVERWRKRFVNVLAHLDEIEGGTEGRLIDGDDPDRQQQRLAETDPALEVHLEGDRIEIDHANLETITVNYYLMDIELLFSNQPFVAEHGGQFAYIRPNRSDTIELRDDENTKTVTVPDDLARRNVMIEVIGGPVKRTAAYFSNSLDVRMMENYGRLQVRQRGRDRAYGGVYVKVYARMSDGEVRFYKDGYTDLRGHFDYASVSGEPQATAKDFAILILSDDHGAVVREAPAPLR